MRVPPTIPSSLDVRARAPGLAPLVAALVAALVLGAAGPAGAADGAWTELSPPCRTSHTAVYDPVRDRVLVFGGYDGEYRNDVWALPLSEAPNWTRLNPLGSAPAPRKEHSAIYDPVEDRILVFGGSDGSPYNDLWQLSLSGTPQWTELTPAGLPPSARSGHSAIYDPIRHRMIVFFGDGGGGVVADAWALTLGASPFWMPLAVQGTAPSARARQSAIYDPPRDRIVIFGGDQGPPFSVLSDTWELSLPGTPAWTLLAPSGSGPDPRSRANVIHDPGGDRMLLHGGAMSVSFFTYDDLWEFSLQGDQWFLRGYYQPLLHDAGAVYDPPRQRMLLTGGSHHALVTLAYTLALPLAPLGSWSIVVSGGPGAIASQTAVLDPARERMVTFGGQTKGLIDPSPRNDTWVYDAGSGAWEDLPVFGPTRGSATRPCSTRFAIG